MKHIVKLFALMFVLSLAGQVHAQSIHLKGGLNLASMNFDNEWFDDDDISWKAGFIAGATVEFPITTMLSLETGMLFASKGYKSEYEESFPEWNEEYSAEETVSLLYVDIPITAKALFNVGDIDIFLTAGPYVGIGITGTYKAEWKDTWNGHTDSGSIEEDIEWGSGDDDDLKRLDFGLLVGAGVEFGSLTVGAAYGMGLANISPHDVVDINNKTISITLGYKINFK